MACGVRVGNRVTKVTISLRLKSGKKTIQISTLDNLHLYLFDLAIRTDSSSNKLIRLALPLKITNSKPITASAEKLSSVVPSVA